MSSRIETIIVNEEATLFVIMKDGPIPVFIGIEEDAATGTAAGLLTGILHRYQLIHKDKTYHILQGEYLNQPSFIKVKLVNEGILVGGSAVITMEGELYL